MPGLTLRQLSISELRSLFKVNGRTLLGNPKAGGLRILSEAANDPAFPDGWGFSRIQDMLQEAMFVQGAWWKNRGYLERAVLGFYWLGVSPIDVMGDNPPFHGYRLLCPHNEAWAVLLGIDTDGTVMQPLLVGADEPLMTVEEFRTRATVKFRTYAVSCLGPKPSKVRDVAHRADHRKQPGPGPTERPRQAVNELFAERYGQWMLLCPACQMEQVHVIASFTRVGSDSYEARVYPGTEAVSCTPNRRSALVTIFRCESNHLFEFVLQQNRGANLVEVNHLPTMTDEDLEAWWKGQQAAAEVRLKEITNPRLPLGDGY